MLLLEKIENERKKNPGTAPGLKKTTLKSLQSHHIKYDFNLCKDIDFNPKAIFPETHDLSFSTKLFVLFFAPSPKVRQVLY